MPLIIIHPSVSLKLKFCKSPAISGGGDVRESRAEVEREKERERERVIE